MASSSIVRWTIGVVLLASGGKLGVSIVLAQSLADVARQEQERRKIVGKPSRVYTNEDVHRNGLLTTAAARESGSPDHPTVREGVQEGGTSVLPHPTDEASWQARLAEARENVSRSRRLLDAMQQQLVGFEAAVAAGMKLDASAQQRRAEIAREVDRLRADAADRGAALSALQEEARQAGAPSGALR
jgi:hypothetical protein